MLTFSFEACGHGIMPPKKVTGRTPRNIDVHIKMGHGGAGAYFKQSTGKRWGTPWTGRQSIAGQHRNTQNEQPCTHSFTPKGKLERPVNPTVMFLDCGSWNNQ
ncbi:hypothetical protein AMECASPLE_009988 [Ameca splendens]|uniref:Uncharacterized protein n=1 Tax=Ameca splendens TaxID=208324 RepID=A0ABV0ZX86_9TELE